MADQWMPAGGAAWLDAVLYDGVASKAVMLLGGDPLGDEPITERNGLFDLSPSPESGAQTGG